MAASTNSAAGEQGHSQTPTKGRLSIGVAVRALEEALAASVRQGQVCLLAVRSALEVVQGLLKAMRQSADTPDGLLSQITEKATRLAPRAKRLRCEYSELERVAASLGAQLETLSKMKNGVEDLRRRVRPMISGLRRVEAMESKLLYEAFWVDIGTGD